MESLAAVIRCDDPALNHFFDRVFLWLSFANRFPAGNISDRSDLKVFRALSIEFNFALTAGVQTQKTMDCFVWKCDLNHCSPLYWLAAAPAQHVNYNHLSGSGSGE